MKDFLIRLEQKPITDKLSCGDIPEWFCRDVATEWIEEGSSHDRDMALKSLEASGISVSKENNTVTITKDFLNSYYQKKLDMFKSIKSFEDFAVMEPDLENIINDRLSLYVYSGEHLYTLSEFLRELFITKNWEQKFFIGNVFVYKY